LKNLNLQFQSNAHLFTRQNSPTVAKAFIQLRDFLIHLLILTFKNAAGIIVEAETGSSDECCQESIAHSEK